MRIHIVQKGDTLWKLAKKYDTDPDQIQATNPTIVNPEMLMPGMKIKVPTATVAVRKEKVIEPKQEKIKPLNKPEVKQPQVKTKNDEWNLDAPPKKQMTQEVQKNVKTTDKGPLPPKPPCQPCQSGNMTNKQMSGHQMNKWNQQNMTQQEMPPNMGMMNYQQEMPPNMGMMNHQQEMPPNMGMMNHQQGMSPNMGMMNHQQEMPPNMGMMNHQQEMPLNMGMMNHQQEMPPNMGMMNHQQEMPPNMGMMNHQQGMSPNMGMMNHQQGMPPNMGMMNHQQGMSPNMGMMNYQQEMPPNMGMMNHQQGMSPNMGMMNHQQGMSPNMEMMNHQQGGQTGNIHAEMIPMNAFMKENNQWMAQMGAPWYAETSHADSGNQFMEQPQDINKPYPYPFNRTQQSPQHHQAPLWATTNAQQRGPVFQEYEPKQSLNDYDEQDD